MSLRLIKPSIAIQIQVIKLYIGNKRARITKWISLEIYDEIIFIEKGYNKKLHDLKW